MSEVIDTTYHRKIGEVYINAHPAPEFSQALERFIDPAVVRKIGGKAIALRSEHSLSVIDGWREYPSDYRRETISKAELATLGRELYRRFQHVHPRVSSEVGISRLFSGNENEKKQEGVSMRFQLTLNELTRQALRNTIFLNPEDDALYMRYRLLHADMAKGDRLIEAKEGLLELLRAEKPGMIESIYLSASHLRP